MSEDTPSQVQGWWGSQGTEVTQVNECRTKDRRPGLTFLRYIHPANFSHPDHVSIINATIADIEGPSKDRRTAEWMAQGGVSPTARLLGFLRTPDSWMLSRERLKMCAGYALAHLRLGANNSTTRVSQNLKLIF